MARRARLVVPGCAHHVTQRGNRRMETFFGAADYRAYLELLAAALEQTGVACWAYCLMPNHVHLILVPPLAARPATAERAAGPAPEDSLRACLGEAHRRYTRRINFRQGWRGHLWQERFHSFVMDAAHLLACARYVEQNPVTAGLAARAQDWPWSSARAHLAGRDDPVCRAAPLLERAARWQGLDWPTLLGGARPARRWRIGSAAMPARAARSAPGIFSPAWKASPAATSSLAAPAGRGSARRRPHRASQTVKNSILSPEF
jgi:putative transposase